MVWGGEWPGKYSNGVGRFFRPNAAKVRCSVMLSAKAASKVLENDRSGVSKPLFDTVSKLYDWLERGPAKLLEVMRKRTKSCVTIAISVIRSCCKPYNLAAFVVVKWSCARVNGIRSGRFDLG